MRKFKHKSTGFVAELNSNAVNYILKENRQLPEQLPLWVVENSNDWEEMKEFPKIISFRKISDKTLYTLGKYDLYWGKEVIGGYTLDVMITQGKNTNYTEIYQVAVSETEVFTLGDKVIIDECNPLYNKGIIKYFKVANDGHIRVEVSNGCNVGVQMIKKAPEHLFVTEDGIEIFEGDTVHWVNSDICNYLYSTKFSEFHPAILKGETMFKVFLTKGSAEEYIDDNKPIYSKKQIKEAFENSFVRENYILDVPYCCADRFKEELFVKKLGL